MFEPDWFTSLADAPEKIEAWRVDYNTQRPHSSLGYQTLEELTAAYGAAFRPLRLADRIAPPQPAGQHGEQPAGAQRLMTHPGVGPVTALATDVFLGEPARFADAKVLARYVGMVPSEYSSVGQQRLGRLSKQGNPLLRFLSCEAVTHAV